VILVFDASSGHYRSRLTFSQIIVARCKIYFISENVIGYLRYQPDIVTQRGRISRAREMMLASLSILKEMISSFNLHDYGDD